MSTAADSPAVAALGDPVSPALSPPPGNPRFALFDSLRAIAVMLTLAFHVAGVTGTINTQVLGRMLIALQTQALTLFFAISGFLLYRPFVSARARGLKLPGIGRYLRRRVLRIVPAYWLALTLLAIYPGIVGPFTRDWWRFYGFLQLYSHRTVGQGIPQAWTLCVEVSFYLLLPLWAVGARRLRFGGGPRAWLRGEWAALGLAAVAGAAVQVAASKLLIDVTFAHSLLGQLPWFALGMALAVLSVAVDQLGIVPQLVRWVVEHPGTCWLGAGLSAAGLALLVPAGGLLGLVIAERTAQPLGRELGTILLTGMLALLLALPAIFADGAARRGVPRRVLAWAPLAWIGLVSYAVYLWHLTLAELLGDSSDPGHFSAAGLGLTGRVHHLITPLLFALTLGASAAVAALSYRFVELPFLRRKEPHRARGGLGR